MDGKGRDGIGWMEWWRALKKPRKKKQASERKPCPGDSQPANHSKKIGKEKKKRKEKRSKTPRCAFGSITGSHAFPPQMRSCGGGNNNNIQQISP